MTEVRLKRLSKKLQDRTGADDKACRRVILGVEDQHHRRILHDSEFIQKGIKDFKRYG